MEKKVEDWKPVIGYEGLYDVSNFGNVRSNRRKGKLLTRYVSQKGYYEVGLSRGNKVRTIRVHRLVAISHLPNPQNLPLLNHIDGNKLNSDVSNLEWCTQSHNMKHAFAIGLLDRNNPKLLNNLKKSIAVRIKPVYVLNITTMQRWKCDSIRLAADFIGVTESCVSHAISKNRTILKEFKVALAEANNKKEE